MPRPSRNQIMKARNYPLYDCLINPSWQEGGLATVVVSRKQPNNNITYGMYLVDVFCLGLKNTYCDVNEPQIAYEYEAKKMIFPEETPIEYPVDVAHQIIYGAIDYAANLGFSPQRDFKLTKYILDPKETYGLNPELQFGKDGRPFYVAGPHDNVQFIIRKLDQKPGRDNYYYVLPIE